MAEISPLRRRMIEDMTKSLADDATILRARGIEVQPVLRTLARHADAGGRADLSSASGAKLTPKTKSWSLRELPLDAGMRGGGYVAARERAAGKRALGCRG